MMNPKRGLFKYNMLETPQKPNNTVFDYPAAMSNVGSMSTQGKWETNQVHRPYELTSKFNLFWIKTLLREGLSEPEFYGDLVFSLF